MEKGDIQDHQLEKIALGNLQTAKTTDSTDAMARRMVVVEAKRRCSDACRKSLYGARLTGAILTVAHGRAEGGVGIFGRKGDERSRMKP